jgi:hypothetical protein
MVIRHRALLKCAEAKPKVSTMQLFVTAVVIGLAALKSAVQAEDYGECKCVSLGVLK